MTKERVMLALNHFPDNFTLDELIEELILLEKIERGLEDVRNNNIISLEKVEAIVSKW